MDESQSSQNDVKEKEDEVPSTSYEPKTCDKCGAPGTFQQIRLIRKGLRRGEKPTQFTWGWKCTSPSCGGHFGAFFRFNRETIKYDECQLDGTALPVKGLEPVVKEENGTEPVKLEQEKISTATSSASSGSPEEARNSEEPNGVEEVKNMQENEAVITEEPSTSAEVQSNESFIPVDPVIDEKMESEETISCTVEEKEKESSGSRGGSIAPTQTPIVAESKASSAVKPKRTSGGKKKSKNGQKNKTKPDATKKPTPKPSSSRAPKGYAYEPIREYQPSPNVQELAAHYMKMREEPVAKKVDNDTQTDCELHQSVTKLEEIANAPPPPELSAPVVIPKWLGRQLEMMKTIVNEQKGRIELLENEKKNYQETMGKVSTVLADLTNINRSSMSNLKCDVEALNKELRFFKMECISEAQSTVNTIKERDQKWHRMYKSRILERDRYKAQLDLAKAQIKQRDENIQYLQYEIDKKDQQVIVAKKEMQRSTKSLNDAMFIRTNQKCMNCQAMEANQKRILDEITASVKEKRELQKRLGDLVERCGELEQQNHLMDSDLRQLHFEHRAYKKDNQRLLHENEQFRRGLTPKGLQGLPGGPSPDTPRDGNRSEGNTPRRTENGTPRQEPRTPQLEHEREIRRDPKLKKQFPPKQATNPKHFENGIRKRPSPSDIEPLGTPKTPRMEASPNERHQQQKRVEPSTSTRPPQQERKAQDLKRSSDVPRKEQPAQPVKPMERPQVPARKPEPQQRQPERPERMEKPSRAPIHNPEPRPRPSAEPPMKQTPRPSEQRDRVVADPWDRNVIQRERERLPRRDEPPREPPRVAYPPPEPRYKMDSNDLLQPWQNIPSQIHRPRSPPVFPVPAHHQRPQNSYPPPIPQRSSFDAGLPWHSAPQWGGSSYPPPQQQRPMPGPSGYPSRGPYEDPNIRKNFWDHY